MTFSEARSHVLTSGSYPTAEEVSDLTDFERVQLHDLTPKPVAAEIPAGPWSPPSSA